MRVLVILIAASFVGTLVPPVPEGPAMPWFWSPDDDPAPVMAFLAAHGAPVHRYENLGTIAFMAPPRLAYEIDARFTGHLHAAETAGLHLDRSVSYVGLDTVADRVGTVRDGPTVLVVDTGVDSNHPDFEETLVANILPVRVQGLVVDSVQENLQQMPVLDIAGHGTHVAGIVSGTGDALGGGDGNNGKFVGGYANGRVASYQASTEGSAEEIRVDTRAALAAFDWAIENQDEFDIRVVTNSWGDPGPFDPDNPVHQATLRLYMRGITVIFSAGNEGEDGEGTLNKYCLAPWVLCVAAGDLDRARTGFSSIGRPDGKPYEHPDLTAPGLFIKAANPTTDPSAGTLLSRPASDQLYIDRSGTSMAAPHVAAAAAQLVAANPELSPDQVMDILVGTTRPMADEAYLVGTGYLDVATAYQATDMPGNIEAFLAGEEVKYAGPLTGDDAYENDPVSVGLDSEFVPRAIDAGLVDRAWVASPLAWAILGLGLIVVLAGFRWR